MAKILLVEDDQSLREIYSIRLTAEGYDITSASDGEEALAAAVRERPELVISDVMMPKISGFDMLDILRSTPETANIKVIMMTALSSEDQRERGEALGANRYLVKSQVGIEDVVNAVHEVLDDMSAAAAPAETPAAAPAAETPAAPVAEAPVAETPAPAETPAVAGVPVPTEAPVNEMPAPAPEATTPETAPEATPAPEAPAMPAPAEVPDNIDPEAPVDMPDPAPQAATESIELPVTESTPNNPEGNM